MTDNRSTRRCFPNNSKRKIWDNLLQMSIKHPFHNNFEIQITEHDLYITSHCGKMEPNVEMEMDPGGGLGRGDRAEGLQGL